MSFKILTEHHLKFLSLKGGSIGSTESTLVKMPHCWKSHVMAHYYISMTRIVTNSHTLCRIGLKAASVLLPLLGLTWTFGFLSITSKETLIFTYLFTLFNSTQVSKH